MYQATVRNSLAWDGTMRSDWNFDTVRSASAMGTFRSMARDLQNSSYTIESEDEGSDNEGEASVNTGGATKGSDPLVGAGLGLNSLAAHSTVVIKPLPSQSSEKDIATLVAMTDAGELDENGEASPQTDEGAGSPLGAPPAYSGSIRSSRRSSYAARQAVNGTGTALRAADLGNGIDTIRPVKKVDAAGSLRLSSEFVGNIRREGSTSAPSSPSTHKRTTSEASKAGKAIVDDIVLPIIQNVSCYC